jgi:serpin B
MPIENVDALTSRLRRSLPPAERTLFSPTSAGYACRLLYEAAAGKTRENLIRAFFRTPPGKVLLDVEPSFAPDPLRECEEVRLANAIFCRADIRPDPEELERLRGSLGASHATWRTAADGIGTVNAWVETATRGRLKKVVGAIRDDETVLLANALTFDGFWRSPFQPGKTQPAPFFAVSGEQIVPMMRNEGAYPYGRFDRYDAVDLLTWEDRFAMRLLLPREGTARSLFTGLESEEVGRPLAYRLLDLRVPQFELESWVDLHLPFAAAGLAELFDSADLSRLFPEIGQAKLYQLGQSNWMRMDELGLQAASATVAFLGRASDRERNPTPFHLDRPFVFALRHVASGQILYMGYVERFLA